MTLDDNDFVLFDVPVQFAQERAQLDTRWRALQGEVHPDKFVSLGDAAQRVAMQWAVRVNEAYQRLKDPIQRAAYLCELQGVVVAKQGSQLPMALLQQQMQWRESMDEAKGAPDLEALHRQATAFKQGVLAKLTDLLDVQRDWAQASVEVQVLMFVDRFVQELNKKLEALEI